MSRVKIVKVDDWEALYLDGKSVFQHHRVEIKDLKSFLPDDICLSDIEEEFRDDLSEKTADIGQLPDRYSDLDGFLE